MEGSFFAAVFGIVGFVVVIGGIFYGVKKYKASKE